MLKIRHLTLSITRHWTKIDVVIAKIFNVARLQKQNDRKGRVFARHNFFPFGQQNYTKLLSYENQIELLSIRSTQV